MFVGWEGEEMELEKTIKILDQEYKMKASMLTALDYQNLYGKDLLETLKKIGIDGSKGNINAIEILRIAHIMIKEANPTFMGLEEWLKGLNQVLSQPEWINEVVMLAMSIFR